MIPLPTNLPITILQRPVICYDKSSGRIDGVYKEDIAGEDYTIYGVLCNPTDLDANSNEFGAISEGDKILYVVSTTRQLYYTDLNNNGSDGIQTYIKDYNNIWRVKGISNRAIEGLYTKYLIQKDIQRG